MHDRHNHDRMNPENPLAGALRDLPAQSPPHDGWPQLAARVRRRRRTRGGLWIGIPAALAAGVALAVLLPGHSFPAPKPPPATRAAAVTTRSASVATDLTRLQSHSQRLQTWVEQLDASGAPLDGRALASAVQLQDQIGLVDLQLSVARHPHAQVPLWHHRIALLQRLALLHLTAGNAYARLADSPTPTARKAAWTN